jgi:lysophospholipase L1-like esterase
MRRFVFPLLAVLVGVGLPYLMIEGIYSLSRGRHASTSLSYDLYRRWLLDRGPLPLDDGDQTTRNITDPSQFEAMMDLFKANEIGIGNSPFAELKTERVAINGEDNGCKVQKPNLRKTMAFVRSNAFNPFDQLTSFYDADKVLPPELAAFLDRYGFRRVRFSTNPHGERLTLPLVSSQDKVLVVGDSVANGVMLDDTETIASKLQALDPARQYINLGISGAGTADIHCALDKAVQRYGGHIRELIYVLCENDFETAAPQMMIDRLVELRREQNIERVMLVYMPFIYNAVPEVTRIPGHSHYDFPTFRAEKKEILARAAEAGFPTIDFLDVTNAEALRGGSQYAPLALYLDHTHLSPPGVDRLVAEIRKRQGRAPRE